MNHAKRDEIMNFMKSNIVHGRTKETVRVAFETLKTRYAGEAVLE